MAKLDYFKIGKIVTTKGLKGDFKVYSHTDNIDRFDEVEEIYIGNDRENVYEVEKTNIDYSKNMVVMKLVDYDTIESVEPFVNKYIYVSREDAYELEEDEYFVDDLIGLQVVTEDGRILGELVEVLKYTANDVYVVRGEAKEYLLPATYDVIPKIDITEGIILVHVIPGLLD